MKLLMIEDDRKLAAIAKEGLEQAGFEVELAYDGETGEELAYVEDYDAILLDLNLPGKDGIEVLKFLRAEDVQTPIVIITARDEVKERALGLDDGADDYVVKPFDFVELVARIRAVIRRAQGRARTTMNIDHLVIDPNRKSVTVDDTQVVLSAKEYEILVYLAQNQNAIISNEDIALHIYGEDFDPMSSVLRVHIANLRRKLTASGVKKDTIQTIKGRGYQLCSEKKN